MNDVRSQFTCKCKKFTGWVEENKETEQCPNCGRKYVGVYSSKKLDIIAKEIKDKNYWNLFNWF